MKLKVLGSGSSGNCYLLVPKSGNTLIVECGIKFKEIKQGLNYKLSNVAGCLVSHVHNDHSASIEDLTSSGIRVFALPDVFSERKCAIHFCNELKPLQAVKIGDFKVFPFDVSHDVPCLGFVIEHEEMGKLLFATDTMMLKYVFKSPLSQVLIEANYSDEILQFNIDNGYVNPSMRERLLGTHMELQTTMGVLKANDLSRVRNIVLIHLSAGNANPDTFRSAVERETGKPTEIARKGLEMEL